MNKQTIKSYFRGEYSSSFSPKIPIKKCVCGKLPVYYGSSGGFNYYGYYKCNHCNLFATGRHQFPAIGITGFGDNENNEPKLFVVYNGEHNPEDGWNNFIAQHGHVLAAASPSQESTGQK